MSFSSHTDAKQQHPLGGLRHTPTTTSEVALLRWISALRRSSVGTALPWSNPDATSEVRQWLRRSIEAALRDRTPRELEILGRIDLDPRQIGHVDGARIESPRDQLAVDV